MKILYVQDSLGTGGAERSNADLWDYLKANEVIYIKVILLEHRKEGIENEVREKGHDITFLDPGNFIHQVRQINNIIKNFSPDIVHSVLFKSVIRVRMAKFFNSFIHIESLVSCSYDPIRYQDPKMNNLGLNFYKKINRLSHPYGTDHFIAISNEVKDHAHKHLKIPTEKISVIPRGRHLNPYVSRKREIRSEIREELKIPFEDIIFVHVGRQEYPKGHLEILKGLERAGEKLRKRRVQFIFCGRKGKATSEIKEFLKAHQIPIKLHWLGHRHDVPKILAASDVFIFPSLFEGLGGALIEAQAAGLPAICSKINVFKEVVRENKSALMFEVGNYDVLADQMVLLGEDEALRREMEKNSLKNFKENFLIEDIHKSMLLFYQNLLN